MMQIIIAVR